MALSNGKDKVVTFLTYYNMHLYGGNCYRHRDARYNEIWRKNLAINENEWWKMLWKSAKSPWLWNNIQARHEIDEFNYYSSPKYIYCTIQLIPSAKIWHFMVGNRLDSVSDIHVSLSPELFRPVLPSVSFASIARSSRPPKIQIMMSRQW